MTAWALGSELSISKIFWAAAEESGKGLDDVTLSELRNKCEDEGITFLDSLTY